MPDLPGSYGLLAWAHPGDETRGGCQLCDEAGKGSADAPGHIEGGKTSIAKGEERKGADMSESPKRYRGDYFCARSDLESIDGEFVLFADCQQALAAERARVREEDLKPLMEACVEFQYAMYQYREGGLLVQGVQAAEQRWCEVLAVVEAKMKEKS